MKAQGCLRWGTVRKAVRDLEDETAPHRACTVFHRATWARGAIAPSPTNGLVYLCCRTFRVRRRLSLTRPPAAVRGPK